MKKYLIILFILFLVVQKAISQNEAQTAFNQGVTFLKAKSYTAAEQQFTIAIEKGETEQGLKMANIYKGFSLNGQGKYDEAILCFDKAIEIDPNDQASYIDRANTYMYNEEIEKAIKDFEKVISLSKSGEQTGAAYYYLGRIMMMQGNNEKAVEYYNSLLEISPQDAEGYFLRGTAKSNLMESEEAIKDYDLAIQYKPDYMEAYANRGVAKLNLIPMSKKTGKIKCLEAPCSDLLMAKELGDMTVDDMIFLYCQKCK